MVWSAARKAGLLGENTDPVHVEIGNVLGSDGKIFRTRSGDLVTLRVLVDSAVEHSRAALEESRPGLSVGE